MESEKIETYVDFARKTFKKLMNMKVTVIPLIIRKLGTISKNPDKIIGELEIRGRIQTFFFVSFLFISFLAAQSAGAVEYTVCFSAEG